MGPEKPNSNAGEINSLPNSTRAVARSTYRHFWHRKQIDPCVADRMTVTPGVLIGIRAAHSGSSTTYAHLGEVRDAWRSPTNEFLQTRLTNLPSAASPNNPLQASLRRQGRGAGILGARFTPEPKSSEIVVRVAIGQSRAADDYDTVGLAQDEGQAVLDGVVAQAEGAPFTELGPGRLDVLWATSHPVDSSGAGFKRLAGSLIPLLALPVEATENDVVLAWRRQGESVRIAEAGGWLTASLDGHPERGVFHAGASEAELESLEASLDLRLPEPVRWMLRRFNGGSFSDRRPQDKEDDSEASCILFDMLSTNEIRTEFFDLIATNESAAEVDRWEGKRPINPRLHQLDGSLLPWPYLPVARTSEGRDILAVEMSGAGRVIDAWHEVGPEKWRPVYERYADFIEDFVLQGGCVKAIDQ